VLRVAEQYAVSDPGRQRRANEDSLLVRAPLFVVADGMGGAQAGEVASRVAIEAFGPGIGSEQEPERELAELAHAANARIHDLSRTNLEHAGMGTTLTAIYVGTDEVAIAHVGDSRAYCLRDGELLRLTDDHSLVDELVRQGRLTPQEAEEHPQRSVITRALGPEGTVDVDTRSFRARAGDVYLICSDGLTTMLSEEEIREILLTSASLRAASEALVAAANAAGGRDNITVVLVRLEDVSAPGMAPDGPHDATQTDIPVVRPAPVEPRRPRAPGAGAESEAARARARTRRRRRRAATGAAIAIAIVGALLAGGYLALQNVYFIGTNQRGLVTMFEGVPFALPGGLDLYSSRYVSGVDAVTVPPARRRTLLDHSLRSEANAAALIRSLEQEELE